MTLRHAIASRLADIPRVTILSIKERSLLGMLPAQASEDLNAPCRTSANVITPLARASAIEVRLPQMQSRDTQEVPVRVPIPQTHQRTWPAAAPVVISENLLKPIGKGEVHGKDYTIVQKPTQLGLTGGGGTYRAPIRLKGPPTRVTLSKVPALWDMLFPLLKPPLDLDFPTQVDLPSELYPFQVEGVRRLVESESFLLADDMGTGKTVMATVALRLLFHKAMVKRALVICPANVISVWDQHVRAWAGSAFLCTVVHGTDPDQRRVLWSTPAHIYVTSYSTFRNDTDEHNPVLRKEDISAFDLAILDEVHHIKNPDAQQSRAVRLLKPKYRWALSGTPLQNSVDDLKAVFRFVDPDMPLQACFSTNEIQELIRPHFLRRRKADVLPDLPDKVVQDLWVELDDDQREAYEGTLQGGREAFEGGEQPLTRMHVFTLLQKLKQICNFAPGKSKSPKLELLLDQLEEVHQAGAKAVVFSQYLSEGVDKLRGALRSTYGQDAVVEIRGQTSREQRQRAVELFQQDAHAALFLGSTRAAGEGISLTSGNYVFHFDHWWNPAVSKQAEDRVHRPGQRKNVTVYHYWAEDTIEERIYQILERKGLLYAELIDAMSEKEIDEAMKMEDWCQVLGLDVSLARKSSEEAGGGGRTITIADILGRFYGLSPDGFEELVAELFQHMGFPNARVTGGAHDGGVDVEAVRNGLGGTERIIIQCKHKRQVGVEAARELLGTVSTDKAVSKGYLVVSGKLSAGCRQFVKDHGNLAAIEAVELAKYIVQFGISISGTDDVRPTA